MKLFSNVESHLSINVNRVRVTQPQVKKNNSHKTSQVKYFRIQ